MLQKAPGHEVQKLHKCFDSWNETVLSSVVVKTRNSTKLFPTFHVKFNKRRQDNESLYKRCKRLYIYDFGGSIRPPIGPDRFRSVTQRTATFMRTVDICYIIA